jgi:hypothetical protein
LTDIVLLKLAAKLLLRVSPPTLVHTLLLSDKGTESSVQTLDRYLLRGRDSPEHSALVKKVRVLGGPSLSERGALCRRGDHDDYACFGG